MQNVYVDWGKAPKFIALDDEGNLLPVNDIFDVLEKYSPVRVFIESTFESKEPEQRNTAIDFAQTMDSEILTLRPSITATYRKLWGITKTTDEVDAHVIRRIATETEVHFSKARKAEMRIPTIQRKADKLGVRGVVRHLGPYASAPSEIRNSLGDGKAYAKTAAMFVVAALESPTRKEFLRRVGCSGSGFPSVLRATFYRRVKTMVRQVFGVRSLKSIPQEMITPVFKQSQKLLHRALRQLYYQVRSGKANVDAAKANVHALVAA